MKQIGTPICVPARVLRILWIVAKGLSQEPHNMLVRKCECSSILSGHPGHLGNFFTIVVEFWRVRAYISRWIGLSPLLRVMVLLPVG